MPKKKQKKYSKPKRPFNKERFKEEEVLTKRYGLKSKREIWKADSEINKVRGQAKKLLTGSEEDQKIFLNKLNKIGLKVENMADILALNKEDYLKRRLQSVFLSKGLCTTPNQARQFIVHKHVTIDGKKVNKPSYIVPIDEENKISLILVKKEKPKKESIVKEAKSEVKEETTGEAKKIEEKPAEKTKPEGVKNA